MKTNRSGTPDPRALSPLRHLPLVPILVLAAILDLNRLSQNGYANTYYSAGVKSMLKSLHNFLFVAFDPGGLITVDKPPLGLWVQAASARIFGFTPLSLLLPEAIAGVISVAVLYWITCRRLGTLAAVIAALSLAVSPAFVAVSRDNNVDTIMILLMALASWAALTAIERGSTWSLVASAVLVGMAFNTKALAAILVVPGIALAYLVCAPGSLAGRLIRLFTAGLVMVVIAGGWIAFVELTPPSERPFVGSSTNNTELNLTFDYNGLGRIEGQNGGPGRIHEIAQPLEPYLQRIERERQPASHRRRRVSGGTAPGDRSAAGHHPGPSPAGSKTEPRPPAGPVRLPNGHESSPTVFGGPVGPLRLFGGALGTQGGWTLAFAVFATLAMAIVAARRLIAGDRRDGRISFLLVVGGWFTVELVVLSIANGIVHPYYTSALAPGAAAMVGAGVATFASNARQRSWRSRWRGLVPLTLALAGTVATQVTMLSSEHYLRPIHPILIAGTAVGLVAVLVLRRGASVAVAATICLLSIAPGVYAATTWEVPVYGTFPAAGPHAAGGHGGFGHSAAVIAVNRKLGHYVDAHHPGTRWDLLTEASDTAAPLILLGYDAGAIGGYGSIDPALNGPKLAALVAADEARYVLIGGPYASRGGNAASHAVQESCRVVPQRQWESDPRAADLGALVLFDCAGEEARLSST